MRYEILVHISSEDANRGPAWSKNVVVDAPDERSAVFQAGLSMGHYKTWGYDMEVRLVRDEAYLAAQCAMEEAAQYEESCRKASWVEEEKAYHALQADHCAEYTCPQCGPDPRGEHLHARDHTFDIDDEAPPVPGPYDDYWDDDYRVHGPEDNFGDWYAAYRELDPEFPEYDPDLQNKGDRDEG